jgi:hypothetical protein
MLRNDILLGPEGHKAAAWSRLRRWAPATAGAAMAATMTGAATEAIMMASAIRLMFVVTAKAPYG